MDWAKRKIKELNAFGIDRDRMILDPGIGFGKSPIQSLSLLRNIDELKKLGCEILVGHSKKLYDDLETVGISHYLLQKGVDYLRVHNVEAHQRSLTARALLESL